MIAASLSLALALFGTPVAIRILRAKGIGQRIREDGPKAHVAKKGTPTMGGLVIIGAAVVAYAAAHIPRHKSAPFTASGLLALFIVVGLGALGFIDDYIKVHKRRSLGLSKRWKIAGQAVLAVVFALLAHHYTQASTQVSFVRPLGIALGPLFVLWVFAVIAASSNGVNLADGLDGLACGSAAMVMGAYVVPRTRSTSRSLRPACWGRRRGSCGGTPRPPASSWGIRGRSRSAGRWVRWRCSPTPIC